MPDADDFDVEYFRNLLKGNSPKAGLAPPAGPSPPIAKQNIRSTSKPVASKEKCTPATGRKKSMNR